MNPATIKLFRGAKPIHYLCLRAPGVEFLSVCAALLAVATLASSQANRPLMAFGVAAVVGCVLLLATWLAYLLQALVYIRWFRLPPAALSAPGWSITFAVPFGMLVGAVAILSL